MTTTNLLAALAIAMQDAGLVVEEVTELEADGTAIAAGEPATVTLPSIGGSIELHAGFFSGSLTFTPNAK